MPFGRPFRAISLCVSFPGLKPWAVFCSPVGRLELAQENVQTPGIGFQPVSPQQNSLSLFRFHRGPFQFISPLFIDKFYRYGGAKRPDSRRGVLWSERDRLEAYPTLRQGDFAVGARTRSGECLLYDCLPTCLGSEGPSPSAVGPALNTLPSVFA